MAAVVKPGVVLIRASGFPKVNKRVVLQFVVLQVLLVELIICACSVRIVDVKPVAGYLPLRRRISVSSNTVKDLRLPVDEDRQPVRPADDYFVAWPVPVAPDIDRVAALIDVLRKDDARRRCLPAEL